MECYCAAWSGCCVIIMLLAPSDHASSGAVPVHQLSSPHLQRASVPIMVSHMSHPRSGQSFGDTASARPKQASR